MINQKILVRRDVESGKILRQELLFDDDTTEHIIIEELPVIEEKEGFVGEYKVLDTGVVEVIYTAIPKSETELLKERMEQQDQLIADLLLELVSLQGGM